MSSSLTPDQALQKVLKVSRLNGWSVALFAGLCTFITILLGDLTGILVGTLVVVCGLMEVRGNRLLSRREKSGMRWLVAAQLLLLAVILVYAGARLMSFRGELALQSLSADMRDVLKQLDLPPEEIMPLLKRIVWAFYGAVMLAACLYQGGLAAYYTRRKPLVEQALAAPPIVSAQK